jgi:murein DD-endopeptidase MepM/ murein hydrolase activator NlpD
MLAHNGTDFRTKHGCPVTASHSGIITWAGKDGDGGISVTITSNLVGKGFKTIYYHLKDVNVAKNETVRAGDLIGWADNTGSMTTGDHLHFGLKEIYNNETINNNNGYKGAIDPTPYFNKNWDKSNAYHRYGRKQDLQAEIKTRFYNFWLHRKLKSVNQINLIRDTDFINALVYGGWDIEAVLNPAMWEVWAYLTKLEYLKGKKPFC